MLRSMPTAVKFATRADPPYEIKGRGTPVSGSSATMEERLIATCIPSQEVKPRARIFPNLSGQSAEILSPRKIRPIKRAIKKREPKKPNSSPTIPNIESVVTSGIYSNFCLE